MSNKFESDLTRGGIKNLENIAKNLGINLIDLKKDISEEDYMILLEGFRAILEENDFDIEKTKQVLAKSREQTKKTIDLMIKTKNN